MDAESLYALASTLDKDAKDYSNFAHRELQDKDVKRIAAAAADALFDLANQAERLYSLALQLRES